MIFLICAIIGIAIGAIWMIVEWGFDADTILFGFLGGLIGLFVALLLWLGICFFPGSNPAVVNTTTTEISALADNARYSNQVSGSVFLIQHRTDEKLKYSYMYKAEGKGYGFYEVPAVQCYINYTTEQPMVQINHMNYKSALFRWLFPDVYEDEYIFYLPEDAEVINDYSIDFN